jgi:nucleoside-diphosphate-sugar epimerase
VGHYLVDEFCKDYELYLLVRNPAKLRFDPATRPNVHIIKGDLEKISDHAELLSRMDYCIHAATAWGGEAAQRVNVETTRKLFSLLNPDRIKRIIYFSTASILGAGNQPLPEAGLLGTSYIKSKYRCHESLPGFALADRVVTVYPTIVLGGDATHPYSHVSSGLPRLKKWAWLAGHVRIDACFHFVHARDIARMVRHLLEQPEVGANNVLGNEPVTFGEFTKRAARYYGRRAGWQMRLTPRMIKRLAKLFGIKFAPWDLFCLEHQDFRYDAVSCPKLGMPSELSTVEGILADAEEHRS